MKSVISTALLFCLCVPLLGQAQGTRADYERAENLSKLTSGKVFKSAVKPRWFAGNTRFWYRNELRDGAREFVIVDAVKGTRGPAFDQARLAAALTKATSKEVKATHLPIRGLEFSEDGKSVVVQLEGGKSWRCDLESYDLREAQASDRAGSGSSLAVLEQPRASRRTGDDTSITFLNKTGGEVEIFWSDLTGKRQPYGKIRPGEQRDQHTFAGHVWLATDAGGKTLAVFEADDQPGTAVIDGKPVEKKTEPKRPSRAARGMRSPPTANGRPFSRTTICTCAVWRMGRSSRSARMAALRMSIRAACSGRLTRRRWWPFARRKATSARCITSNPRPRISFSQSCTPIPTSSRATACRSRSRSCSTSRNAGMCR